MSQVLWGVVGALLGVIGTGAFAYLVHRENLRDQRLKERLDRIYEAQEAAYRAYDMTLHAAFMVFYESSNYHEQAMLALPEVGRFLALYKRLHIPEDADLTDKIYDPIHGLLDAAKRLDIEAKEVHGPLLETGAREITDQLISLSKETEAQREKGWLSVVLLRR